MRFVYLFKTLIYFFSIEIKFKLSPFYPPQTINGFPNPSRLTSTTIDDNYSSPLSSFSSATSVDHVPTIGRSSISSRTNTHSRSMDYSTDNFKDRYFLFNLNHFHQCIF